MKSKKGVAKFLHSQCLFWGVEGREQTSQGNQLQVFILKLTVKCRVGSLPCLTAALTYSCFKVQACYKIDRYRSAVFMKIREIITEYSKVFVNMKNKSIFNTSVGNVSLEFEKQGLQFSGLNFWSHIICLFHTCTYVRAQLLSCVSLQPHRLQPARFLCPWDYQGKNTGVGCCALLQGIGEGNGKPLQYSCLEHPMDGGAWQAAVHGVTKSRK